MSTTMHISSDELIQQIKLSCQLPTAIAGIVNRKMIESTAASTGITIESDELQQAADVFRLTNQLLRADDTQLWLEEHHLTVDEFEDIVRLSALSSKLASHLFADRVEPFFVEHQLDYAQVVMYEVTLDDADLAMELFYAIQENEVSFHEVAHHYIQDVETRRCGGYRGVLQRTDLKPEISAAVFAAKPPQLLKPIVTAKGAHLILVEEIIRPTLDKSLYQKILSDLFLQWLKQQETQIDVVVLASAETTNQNPRLEKVLDRDRTTKL